MSRARQEMAHSDVSQAAWLNGKQASSCLCVTRPGELSEG